jgi:hypothetical protein
MYLPYPNGCSISSPAAMNPRYKNEATATPGAVTPIPSVSNFQKAASPEVLTSENVAQLEWKSEQEDPDLED